MKVIIVACLVGYVASVQYVWDILKPALNAAEVQQILANNPSYPKLVGIPASAENYDCTQKKPGFYADVSSGCQVFHRCDINGNLTNFLCVNTTVFNQITLVCDYFFNVDCQRFVQYEDFANSRLYSDKPLFDTPPADLVPVPLSSSRASLRGGSRAAFISGGLSSSPLMLMSNLNLM